MADDKIKKHPVLKVVEEPRLIKSTREFVADFTPPEYLLDGILQRRFLYSFTGQTGGGKTAIALLLAAHVSRGVPLYGREIPIGRALYFAGENPDDIRMRWIVMQELGIAAPDGVHFVEGAYGLQDIASQIRAEANSEGLELAVVVVDTSAAYFRGDDENSNVQLGAHARDLRQLVELPGGPTVIVCCHPIKGAGNENLLPRGGGAFLAEVDGNIVGRKNDTHVELHWQGKFRGPEFSPLAFQLKTVTHPALKDRRGRMIPTVVAQPLSESGREEIAKGLRADDDAVLRTVAIKRGTGPTEIARTLAWWNKDTTPSHMRVNRAAERLKRGGLLNAHRDGWDLTPRGEKELKAMGG